jgi:hypothetical protein
VTLYPQNLVQKLNFNIRPLLPSAASQRPMNCRIPAVVLGYTEILSSRRSSTRCGFADKNDEGIVYQSYFHPRISLITIALVITAVS